MTAGWWLVLGWLVLVTVAVWVDSTLARRRRRAEYEARRLGRYDVIHWQRGRRWSP